MPHLAENHYGKSRVRVVKVVRSSEAHQVFEWSVGVYLTGDFGACFLDGENAGLLATDTMKNTVYVMAQASQAATMEDFAQELARFLMDRNPQLSSATIAVEQKAWLASAGCRQTLTYRLSAERSGDCYGHSHALTRQRSGRYLGC